ncbi:flagellar hook-associated protein FlgK [Clostridium sp. YIM B02505]|uniref:Flagellar hook-associated protein 1 n=1 Tax=Clostridium yunnanense TaxID=2800325 RepID=A0ABS1EUA5_9CLOT|nr:flagellar hook-associated protein FlgK [Clostridium yunnanense]MBK1812942.1 flagellar hook-associated protein FlgK [Clostridium yunnanense]
MSGLFSTFNIAKSGMSVQQKSIDVTSHNIANANTAGYSRQRAIIETTRPQSLGGMEAGQLGTGAQVSTVERIRDTFLDYQVRNETSISGQYSTRESFLSQIEDVFTEPSDTGISSLMGKFFDSWQQLSKQPQSSNARTVVVQQTLALTDALNHTYTQLKDLKNNAQSLIKNTVTDMNSTLNQIGQLNKEIISVKNAGDTPNDLMDKRDLLIDQLSSKFNLNIDKKAFEGINLKPADVNGMKAPELVKADGDTEVARFSYISSMEKDPTDDSGTTYKITYYKLGNMDNENNKQTITLTNVSPDQAKEIEQTRVIWANSNGVATKADGYPLRDGSVVDVQELKLFSPASGEVKGNVTIQKDIDNYIDQVNKLAKSIAFTVNAVHSGMSSATTNGFPDKDYMPLFVNKSVAKYSVNGQMINLDDTLKNETEITAENITVNKEILSDVMKLKTKTRDSNFAYASQNTVDGEGDGARALAIAQLKNNLIAIQDIGTTVKSRADLFDMSKGKAILKDNGLAIENNNNGTTLEAYFKDTIDKLGVQAQEASRMVTNQQQLLDSLNQTKDSVSGVSLDEEMANLVQFQHAYSANAKVIATVDELLDVVVNGLKR